MIKIREISAKSILTRSGLPGADYVINPYTGCLYCYASFMKKYSGHSEDRSRFVNVKTNAPSLVSINPQKTKEKQ